MTGGTNPTFPHIQPSLFRKLKDAVKNFLPDKLDEAITPFLSKVQKRLGLN